MSKKNKEINKEISIYGFEKKWIGIKSFKKTPHILIFNQYCIFIWEPKYMIYTYKYTLHVMIHFMLYFKVSKMFSWSLNRVNNNNWYTYRIYEYNVLPFWLNLNKTCLYLILKNTSIYIKYISIHSLNLYMIA